MIEIVLYTGDGHLGSIVSKTSTCYVVLLLLVLVLLLVLLLLLIN